jgi:hypothetical protein
LWQFVDNKKKMKLREVPIAMYMRAAFRYCTTYARGVLRPPVVDVRPVFKKYSCPVFKMRQWRWLWLAVTCGCGWLTS